MRWLASIIFFGAIATAASSAHARNGEAFDGPMVLALSWQPAFCEKARRRPECRSQTRERYDADHFALHGLWPQPGSRSYCNVPRRLVEADKRRRWSKLPPLGLSQEMRKAVWRVMPGSQSFLHRHEWVKHGTCYSKLPETYYRHSVALIEAINRSPVRELFRRSIGRRLTNRAIRHAFDKAFGDGVGLRVRVSCRRDGRRELISEVTLGLSGTVSEAPDIQTLALASPATKPGCPVGVVDPTGYQ